MLKRSPEINELAKALAVAQGSMEAAKKDKNNPAFGKASKYADLASIWDAVREPISKQGLSVIQLPFTDEQGRVNISTLLMHSSGQWIEASYALSPTKNDPQGFGSAITYMKRYALTGVGVAPEDDDGNAAAGTSVGSGGYVTHGTGNGNGHAKNVEPLKRPVAGKPEEEAKKYVAKAEAELAELTRIDDLRRWDTKNKEWLVRLHAIDPPLANGLQEVIATHYRRLNVLGAG
jgi:hypothetical protein